MRVLWLLLLCVHMSASAQVEGVVKNDAGAPVQGISVTLKKADNGAVLAFTRTNDQGAFKINIPQSTDSLFLYIQSLLYQEVKVYLSPEKYKYSFVLHPSEKKLEEVLVKPPVLRRNDTLSYRVDQFTQTGDRTLADMMGRIPGLEVAGDGRILYQGNAIEKYYIEGLDLLGGRYGLANNNLLAEQVDRIEVLEKHQSVRLLDGRTESDRTSLNIRLKNKYTATVPLTLGGGLPLQGLAEFLPMVFSPYRQFIGGLKYHSTGKDIAADVQDHGTQVDAGPSVRTGILPVNKPPLSSDRYRFATSAYGTVNALSKLKSGGVFRTNAAYLWEEVRLSSLSTTRYLFQDQTVEIQEDNRSLQLQKKLVLGAEWSENTKEKYFSNAMKVTLDEVEDRGDLQANKASVLQKAESRVRQFSNVYRQMVVLGAQTVQVGAAVVYKHQPQFLGINAVGYVFPFAPERSALQQEVRDKVFDADVYATTYKRLKGLNYSWTASAAWKDQRLESALLVFKNDLRWTETRVGLLSTLGQEREKWRFSLEIPLYYVGFQYEGAAFGNRWIGEPKGLLGYKLGQNWELVASGNRRYQFGDIGSMYTDYILVNYRNLQRREAFFNQKIHNSVGFTAKFHDPFRYVNAWAMFNYTQTQRNALSSLEIPETGFQQFTMLSRDNTARMSVVNGGLKYIVPKVKVTLSLLGDASVSRQMLMLNGEVGEFQARRQHLNFSWNTRPIKGWAIQGEHSWAWTQTGQESAVWNRMRQQRQGLQLRYALGKRHIFTSTGSVYTFKPKGGNSAFVDLMYRYKHRGYEVELAWQNMGNTRAFQQVYITEFTELVQRTPLRPAQVLVTLRWTWSMIISN